MELIVRSSMNNGEMPGQARPVVEIKEYSFFFALFPWMHI